MRSAAVVSSATRPPKPPCWVYYAPRCRHSRHRRAGLNGIRYARQSRQKPPQTRILYAPNPTGEMNNSGTSSNQRQSSAPQHNIIPSGLCNRSLGPQPHRLFSLSHTIRIMLSCSVIAFCAVIPCRCRVGGSYGFAEGRDHPSLYPLSQDLARMYISVIPPTTVSSLQPSCLR